jgi:hypothetical protein
VSREASASIDIEAPASRVWQVLTDFAAYPSWNPFILRIDGPLSRGALLTFLVATGPGQTTTARARLLEIEKNRRLVWAGGLPLGLFRGVHTFILEPALRGTRLWNNERFSGPVAALTIREPRLRIQRQAFAAFNDALKRRVEAPDAVSQVQDAKP